MIEVTVFFYLESDWKYFRLFNLNYPWTDQSAPFCGWVEALGCDGHDWARQIFT